MNERAKIEEQEKSTGAVPFFLFLFRFRFKELGAVAHSLRFYILNVAVSAVTKCRLISICRNVLSSRMAAAHVVANIAVFHRIVLLGEIPHTSILRFS